MGPGVRQEGWAVPHPGLGWLLDFRQQVAEVGEDVVGQGRIGVALVEPERGDLVRAHIQGPARVMAEGVVMGVVLAPFLGSMQFKHAAE